MYVTCKVELLFEDVENNVENGSQDHEEGPESELVL